MTVAIEQTYLDAGAPDKRAGAGALIAILDFVLLPRGWTKPPALQNAGTFEAVYETNLSVSVGFHLYVNDADPNFAEIRGYKLVTGVNPVLGNDPFPILTQVSRFQKRFTNSTSGANENEWFAYSTGRFCWLMGRYRNLAFWTEPLAFGEINLRNPADLWGGALAYRAATSNTNNQVRAFTIAVSGTTGWSICRNTAGAAPALNAMRGVDGFYSGANTFGARDYDGFGGAVDMSTRRVVIGDNASNRIRGTVPGMVAPMADKPYNDQDFFDNTTGPLAGARTRVFEVYNNGQIWITTHTDYWQ